MLDVRRRQFITLLRGAAAAWPLVARAQRQDRTRRIGVLMAYAEGDRECDRVAPSAGAARETLCRKQIESL
jgi:hypothetical protein